MANVFSSPADTLVGGFNAVLPVSYVPITEAIVNSANALINNTTVLEPQGISSFNAVLPVSSFSVEESLHENVNINFTVSPGQDTSSGEEEVAAVSPQVWIG